MNNTLYDTHYDSYYDIVIAGGGMVGLSLACALAQSQHPRAGKQAPLKVLVAESIPLTSGNTSNTLPVQPSFDSRSTALSVGTRDFYEAVGVWPRLAPYAQPILQIHVSDRGRFGSVLMDAQSEQLEALGFIVENRSLGRELLACVKQLPAVDFHCPAQVVSITPGEQAVTVAVQQGEQTFEISTGLVVIADGAKSSLRSQLGIETEETPYRQQALITNVAHRKNHQGCAFERFTDLGPMACLPLFDGSRVAAQKDGLRSALVWTLPEDQVHKVLEASDSEFLAQLQNRFGYRLGRFTRVGERHVYPLSLIQSKEQCRTGVVVMGNAAHLLHPVAGQGLNLSLRDAARLAEKLLEAHRQQQPLGSLRVLQAYCNEQRHDQETTILASGLLPGLFSRTDLVTGVLRDMGLIAMDLLPPLKTAFIRQATGLTSPGLRSHWGFP